MKIIIFGATGTVGIHLVKQSLEKGHHVTAFCRNPEKLQSLKDSKLSIYIGDVLNPDQVSEAIRSQDLVICTLGAGKKGGVRAQGTHNIIEAMKAHGVRRLVCQSTLGCGDSRENLNFLWKHLMFGWLLKEAFQDHQDQENHVFKSGLDWTLIRPAAFTDGPLTGHYKAGFPSNDKSITLKISRADIAHYMLRQLEPNESNLHRCVGLSY